MKFGMWGALFVRRQFLAVVVAGLVSAALAVGVAAFALPGKATTYRAQAQVVLVPGPHVTLDQVPAVSKLLGSGEPETVAAQVLVQPRWKAAAGDAARVPQDGIVVTASVVPNSSLINVAAETTSAVAAEEVLTAILGEARPVVEQVSGPFSFTIVQPAAGTAVAVNVSRTPLLVAVFVSGLLIGSGLGLIVTRAGRRPDPLPATTSQLHQSAKGATLHTDGPPAQRDRHHGLLTF